MSDILVYQTSDPRFAAKAVDAMLAANIPSYLIGTGFSDLSTPARGRTLGPGISIYIENGRDHQPANKILLELGAVADEPIAGCDGRRDCLRWTLRRHALDLTHLQTLATNPRSPLRDRKEACE